ncbi:hypothetical protein LEN26_021200 [Aphanomyces euteiches]|nr:hypothetical protein LEN26_021200 [Aphanomyces euteiches]
MTAMLLADNSDVKHPLMLVLRTAKSKIRATVEENLSARNGFGKRLWQDVSMLQERHGCQIHGNPTAWWNASLSIKFLKYHFAHRPDRERKKVLLLWDDFSAHFTDDVVAYAKELNVVLERIPPSYTWICQPADVAWNRPLKCKLRQNWLDLIKQQLLHARSHSSGFTLVPPTRGQVVEWVTNAWSNIEKTTIVNAIVNGFRKCRLVDGEPDHEESARALVDDEMLAALMERHAIEDTIDPTSDFSGTDPENDDEQLL